MKYLALLLLCGCATQMGEVERLEHELDRKEKYSTFKVVCREVGGVMFWYNPLRRCRRECIPHRKDWDFYYKKEDVTRLPGELDWRPKPGNAVTCGRWR